MKKRRRIKFELIFCCISVVFILIMFLFFGFKIYINNKKYSENTISKVVVKNKTIDNENGIYIFKGKDVDNYIKFSNMNQSK